MLKMIKDFKFKKNTLKNYVKKVCYFMFLSGLYLHC